MSENQSIEISDLNKKVKWLMGEIKGCKNEIFEKWEYIKKFQFDLFTLMQDPTNKAFHQSTKWRELYNTYSGTLATKTPGEKEDPDRFKPLSTTKSRKPSAGGAVKSANPLEEWDRQKRAQSRKIVNLTEASERSNEASYANNMRKIGENWVLIEQLNELRKSNKALSNKVKSLELEIKDRDNKEQMQWTLNKIEAAKAKGKNGGATSGSTLAPGGAKPASASSNDGSAIQGSSAIHSAGTNSRSGSRSGFNSMVNSKSSGFFNHKQADAANAGASEGGSITAFANPNGISASQTLGPKPDTPIVHLPAVVHPTTPVEAVFTSGSDPTSQGGL